MTTEQQLKDAKFLLEMAKEVQEQNPEDNLLREQIARFKRHVVELAMSFKSISFE